jgi:hypothetical protein
MEIKDMLAVPQLFCIKKDGVLIPMLGMGDEVHAVKFYHLFTQHSTVGCGDPSCDCTDKAFDKLATGCEVVPVSIVEVVDQGKPRKGQSPRRRWPWSWTK